MSEAAAVPEAPTLVRKAKGRSGVQSASGLSKRVRIVLHGGPPETLPGSGPDLRGFATAELVAEPDSNRGTPGDLQPNTCTISPQGSSILIQVHANDLPTNTPSLSDAKPLTIATDTTRAPDTLKSKFDIIAYDNNLLQTHAFHFSEEILLERTGVLSGSETCGVAAFKFQEDTLLRLTVQRDTCTLECSSGSSWDTVFRLGGRGFNRVKVITVLAEDPLVNAYIQRVELPSAYAIAALEKSPWTPIIYSRGNAKDDTKSPNKVMLYPDRDRLLLEDSLDQERALPEEGVQMPQNNTPVWIGIIVVTVLLLVVSTATYFVIRAIRAPAKAQAQAQPLTR